MISPFFYYLIIALGIINLLRMALFLITSDIYHLKDTLAKKKSQPFVFPSFSVVIPAHNEQSGIINCVSSISANYYPKDSLQIIVVDDGSTDNTALTVENYINTHPNINLVLVRQKNSGKAQALNNGMKNYANGELIMCLDSDSILDQNALRNAARHFQNPEVAAISSNIKIIKRRGILNLIQRYEYLICYQIKRAESVFNFQYIVGGVASTFRKSVLEKVGYYDTNTVTEDIDLTMKVLNLGNRKYKVIYGADVISRTEAVLSIKDLLKQRFRWKWGRSQTFLKNRHMFFSRDNKYTRGLTWFYLPFALYGEITYFLEPFLLSFILINSIVYSDLAAIASACIVISTYVILNILAEDTLPFKEKLGYIALAPFVYLLFYVLSFVEYVALVRTLANLRNLRKSILSSNQGWIHVDRPQEEALS